MVEFNSVKKNKNNDLRDLKRENRKKVEQRVWCCVNE
jgi:hypothetical protein